MRDIIFEMKSTVIRLHFPQVKQELTEEAL